MTAEREGLAEIAGVLRWHALHASMNICSCRAWRATPDAGSLADQHRAHLADALADLLAARDRRVRAALLKEILAARADRIEADQ